MIPPVSPDTAKAMGGNSGRMGRSLRQLRDARSTWAMARALVLTQAVPVIWDWIVPGAGKLFLAQRTLGLTESAFLSGSAWQVLSYGFIHADWFHLFANIACILLLGPKLERIIPKPAFWLVALFSILAGGACFLLLSPSAPHAAAPQTLVGSSAICFGLLVMLTTLSPESRFLPLFLSGRTIGIAIILANLSLALLNPDLPTGPLATWGEKLADSGPDGLFQISHACHLGGSLAGWLCAKFLLRPRVSLKSLQRAREKRESPEKSKKAST